MPSESSATRRFVVVLALLTLGGVGLRVGYVLAVTQHDKDLYDATYYELQASSIVRGEGFFDDPFLLNRNPDDHQPAADHPPLTVIALLPAATIDDSRTANLAMRFTMVLIGAGTIVLTGLLGRALAGDGAGILAGAVAALDPNLWMIDGLVMSESLATFLTVGLILGSYRALRGRPRWGVAIGLGAGVGLAALTRAELALLLPFVVAPALWIAGRRDRRAATLCVVTAGLATALVVAPWVGYNLQRFESPVYISTSDGLALRAANCETTYYGDLIGWAEVFEPCAVPAAGLEQSAWNDRNREAGLRYMGDHLDRLPLVVLARLGRSLNVFAIGQTAELTSREGRPVWATWMGAVATWTLSPLAFCGAVALRRRGERIFPLVVPIVVTLTTVALFAGGLLRYRAPAEPGVIVLAAAGALALLRRGPWSPASSPATEGARVTVSQGGGRTGPSSPISPLQGPVA